MFVLDRERDQNDVSVLEIGDTAVHFRRERLNSRSIGFSLGAVEMDDMDVGEIVFSEDGGNLLVMAHGDISKCVFN